MLSLVYNAKAFCKTTGRFKWKSKVWRHCCNVRSFCDLFGYFEMTGHGSLCEGLPGGTLQNSPWENLLAGQVRIQVRIEDLIHGVETWNNFVQYNKQYKGKLLHKLFSGTDFIHRLQNVIYPSLKTVPSGPGCSNVGKRYPPDKSPSSTEISVRKTNCVFDWIVIYPVDSAIHLLNNWGQNRSDKYFSFEWTLFRIYPQTRNSSKSTGTDTFLAGYISRWHLRISCVGFLNEFFFFRR